MKETKVYEGKLSNDVPYEIHISEGFSGKSEIAVKILEEIVSVTVIEVKRTGNIVCQPANSRRILIKREFKEENGTIPSLDDVLKEPQDKDPGAQSV